MTPEKILEYCLTKKGAYLDHPFGIEYDIVKVKKRIFAQIFCLKGEPMLTVNGDAVTNSFFRQAYPDSIRRGYHCPPVQQPYFNTINLNGTVSDDEIKAMVDNSYTYVVNKLTKKLQKELEEEI